LVERKRHWTKNPKS